MRKITSLLMLFCMFVGTAWAEVTLPATDKAFTVIAEGHKSGVKPGWAINNEKTAMVSFGNTAVTDDAQKNFAFIQYEGKVYLYSVWAEKFVNKDMSLTDILPVDDITVENVDGGKYFFKYDDSHIMNIGGSKQLAPDTWSTKDGGNQYTLTEVGSFNPAAALAILDNSWEITYQFKYNGTLVATQTTKIAKGANYPAVNAELLPWGAVASSVPSGAPTKNETIELTCSVDVSLLPFVPADSYNDAEMKWYYLQFHATNKNYLYYTAADQVLLADKTALDKENKDAYTWAFVGNPFDGYTIYNRKAYNADNDLKLNAAADGAVLGKEDHKFKPTASAHAVKGFFLASEQGANTNRFNKQDDKVVYWSGADAGSTFMVTERPMGPVAELNALIIEAEALLSTVNANIGTKIGEYTQATADALTAAINTANGIVEAENATADDVANLQAAMDAVKVILPTVGQYYQIHSSLTAFTETKAAYSNGTQPEWKTLNNDDQSFYWQAVATADGGVAFKNAKDGKYLQGHGYNQAWTLADESTNAGISVKIFAKGENEKGYEYGLIIGGYQMHAMNHGSGAGAGSYFVGYNTDNANSASSWFIVQVDYQEFHDVTYNFVYNDDVKYSTTTSVADGAAYPAVVVPTLPYGVIVGATTTPEGAVTENTVKNFELSVEKALPFSTDTWCYAQMHANGSVTAYIQDTNEATNVDWNDHIVEATEIDAHLWKFVGDIWSGIKVINKATGRAIVSTSGAAVLGDVANATAFVPTNSQAGGNWFCLKYPTNNQYLNAQGKQEEGKGTVDAWTDNDNGSSLLLTEYKETEVEVSNEAGYATLYLGQATYIPADVEVYAVTGIEGAWATMTAVEGVLPANTGVILKNAGTYTFKTAGATGSVEGNLLRGSVEDTYVEGLAYVLADGEDGIGLYKATLNKDENGNAGTTHFLNNANKAYLVVEGSSDARFLSFDFGNETAIENIEGAENGANAVIYDLSGRRVQKAQKGLYIINGAKVIK